MMKKIRNTAIITVLIIMLCVFTGCGQADNESLIQGAADYIEETYGSSFTAGDSISEWTLIMLSRAGIEADFDGYLDSAEKYVTARYKDSEKLDRIKATEWHRTALAITAAGGDPTAFGKDKNGKPVNLIAEGTYNWKQTDKIDMQGSNALIYALITLDSKDYEIPDGAEYTREKLVKMLLGYQGSDGAFGLSDSNSADTDITAMAVQALAPYKLGEAVSEDISKELRQQVEKSVDSALGYLSEAQRDSGLYMSGGDYSSETTSQVILALCSLNIDPETDEDFIKADRTLTDGLMEYSCDDGSFAHSTDEQSAESGDRVMSSQQAGSALTAIEMLKEERGRYFDFN